MNAFAMSTVAAAQTQIQKCAELLKKAASSPKDEEWKLIGQAMGCAAAANAWLNDAMKLDAMTDDGPETENGE